MSFVQVMEELKKMMGGSPLGSRVWGCPENWHRGRHMKVSF